MKQILVVREKHETYYCDASTPELLAKSALEILQRRFEQGWFYEPQELEPELVKQANLTDEEIAALPTKALQQQATQERNRAKRYIAQESEHARWYEEAKAVVESNDTLPSSSEEGSSLGKYRVRGNFSLPAVTMSTKR